MIVGIGEHTSIGGEVECIIHQGAMSSTTNTNLREIFTFNIEFSEWLFNKAAKYNIPVKYASSASVWKRTRHYQSS